MPAKLFMAATAVAIPFGSPPSEAPPEGPPVEMSASFEFVETDAGYDLNAVVTNHSREEMHRTFLDRCETIDIDSFHEDLFGTPALCDGRRYVFDVTGSRLVAVAQWREREVMRLDMRKLVLNGVPLMVGVEQDSAEAPSIFDDGEPR